MSRATRFLGRALAALGVLVLWTVVLAVSVVVHLDTPPGRRTVVALVNDLLEDAFQGTVRLEHLGHLGLGGVAGVTVRVLDPAGRQVLFADGVSSRIDLSTLLAGLRDGRISVDIPRARIDYSDVRLISGDEGVPTLAAAFEPPESREPAGAPGPAVTVALRDARVERAWVHGNVGPGGVLDGDVSRLQGNMALTPGGLDLGVEDAQVRLRAMPQGANPVGHVSGKMETRSGAGIVMASAAFDGAVGPAPVSARARLEEGQLAARARVGTTSPEELGRLLPGAPIHSPVSAELRARGPLERIEVSSELRIGDGAIDVDGTIRLGPGVRIDAHVVVDALRLRSFAPEAPRAAIDLDADVSLAVLDERLSADLEMAVSEFSVDGIPVPATTWDARLRRGVLEGRATAAEPGMPLSVTYRLVGEPDLSRLHALDFTASARIDDLNGIARLGELADGRGTISASGRLSFEPLHLEARGDATLRDVRHDVLSARSVNAAAEAHGPPEQLRFEGTIDAHRVTLLGLPYARARARARGGLPLQALDVRAELRDEDERAEARARLRFEEGIAAQSAFLSVTRHGVRLDARADEVRLQAGTLQVDGGVVEGAGRVEADLRWSGDQGKIRARAKSVDLARVGRFAGVEGLGAGEADLEAELVRDAQGIDGFARARMTRVQVRDLPSGLLQARLRAERSVFDGSIFASVGCKASARVVIDQLRVPSWNALRDATGGLALHVHGDLSILDTLPDSWLPIARARGRVLASARLSRARPRDTPDIDAYLATEALNVVLDEPPRQAPRQGFIAWALGGNADAELRARFEAEANRLHLSARLQDRRGELAEAAAVATVPARALSADPSRVLRAMTRAPFFLRARVPPRRLRDLPDPVRPDGISGKIDLIASASGTLLQPELHAHAHLIDFAPVPPGPLRPVDVLAKVTYEKKRGKLEVEAIRAGRKVLLISSDFETDAPSTLVSGRPMAWRASARANFDELPLNSVGWLTDFGLEGRLSGYLLVDDLHENARLNGSVRVDDLQLGTGDIGRASARFVVDEGRARGDVALVQKRGAAELRAETRVVWGERMVPELVKGAPVDLEMKARRLDVSFLLPFASDAVTKLGGTLDAHVALSARGPDESIRGFAQISDGVVQIPTVGHEFSDIEATVIANGSDTIELDQLEGRGVTGEFSATGTAELDGLALDDIHIEARIPKGEELPVTLQGVTLGRAWGRVMVDLELPDDAHGFRVAVRVPKLEVELPENPRRNVQPLGDAPDIRIGVHHPSGRFDPLPMQLIENGPAEEEDQKATMAKIELGRDVWIRQSTKLEVRVTGAPVIVSREETRMRGQIEIAEGFIDVLGKRFEIDQGVATFTGDPSNPSVVARARWESPEGISVIAVFTGSAQDGELELMSEPPYTESEVLSILLFGTPEGTMTGAPERQESGGAAGGAAAGVGSGIATAGLNRALSDLSNLEITTRVDTSDPAGPRPEVAVQVTRRLTAEVAYNPAAGSAITRTPDHALLTLTLRLPRSWSVETTFGDAGTSIVDLVWRHRY